MEPGAGRRALRILLVEDEPDISEPMGSVLREEGHDVTLAMDGAQAMACLESGDFFDLVLSDLRLPKIDGLTVARRAVERGGARVVVMSGQSGLRERLRREGGIGFLSKPFDLDALLAVVDEVAATDQAKAKAP